MLTNKDYCDYDTCVALKELGYKEPSNWWYSSYKDENDKKHIHLIKEHPQSLTYESWHICPKDFIICPTLYEAQKWLREEKGTEITVFSKGMVGSPYYFHVYFEDYADSDDKYYDSYEEALSEGIKEAVKILKEE